MNNFIQRITIEYIESVLYLLNHNNPKYPLLVDVDKISEFLYEESKWSSSNTISIDVLYTNFLIWLSNKYNIIKYNKNIFITKISKKRIILDNKVQNIELLICEYNDELKL
jgi:hypothetical protein